MLRLQWLNDQKIITHVGGHLPFEVEVTNVLKYAEMNLLTVAVNNTLTRQTIPHGEFQYKNDQHG